VLVRGQRDVYVEETYIWLFCGDTGLFCDGIGLFSGDMRFFCGDIGLYCGLWGSFAEIQGSFAEIYTRSIQKVTTEEKRKHQCISIDWI